jgi:hypothetical protein
MRAFCIWIFFVLFYPTFLILKKMKSFWDHLAVCVCVLVSPSVCVPLSNVCGLWGLWYHLAVCLCVRVCPSVCVPLSNVWGLWGLWYHLAVCLCARVCPSVCVPLSNVWGLWGLWYRLAACVSSPKFLARVVSKENRRLVLPMTSCVYCDI